MSDTKQTTGTPLAQTDPAAVLKVRVNELTAERDTLKQENDRLKGLPPATVADLHRLMLDLEQRGFKTVDYAYDLIKRHDQAVLDAEQAGLKLQEQAFDIEKRERNLDERIRKHEEDAKKIHDDIARLDTSPL